MTSEAIETLTMLVNERVGEGRAMTWRSFEAVAVDPKGGYKPSRATLWKIGQGQPVKLSPELVRAVAEGLGIPPERAQRAAAYQYAGYVATDTGKGTIVHEAGAEPGDKAQAVLDRWDQEEA
ncbi:hypothetical protein [Streptomyces sp. NEAU-NA10]|uniref:hypothetical protein n=1 Tax=Streptomyces sp. NEAU-NA10 TaxID=3416050 RepID=UPI003CC5474C